MLMNLNIFTSDFFVYYLKLSLVVSICLNFCKGLEIQNVLPTEITFNLLKVGCCNNSMDFEIFYLSAKCIYYYYFK